MAIIKNIVQLIVSFSFPGEQNFFIPSRDYFFQPSFVSDFDITTKIHDLKTKTNYKKILPENYRFLHNSLNHDQVDTSINWSQ